jgi:two-component system, OmpR family, copper resistance phosphate regulon response regulator CusR
VSRVLLVEDATRIAGLVATALQRDGHEVVVAEDGGVGLFLATTEAFDVVVLDLGLPGVHGMDVLAQLQAARAELPVLMLTGRDEPAVREACLAGGAADVMTKPFALGELRERVTSLLGGA